MNTVWPKVAEALFSAGVKLLLDAPSLSALQSSSVPIPSGQVGEATDEHYSMEHLTLTASVKTIPSLGDAITWINDHSSHHTDSIVTENDENASAFCRGVDSAGTYVNASTRFADGFRYGFGTEVGISTGRIHARGPVGLEGLVTYKYMMKSQGEKGHIASEFGSGSGKKPFKHQRFDASSVPFA